MSLDKRKILLNVFLKFHFSYCTLIWIFHSRTLTTKINQLPEKALRIIYSNFKAKFDELLEKDRSFSIYYRNIRILAIEIFKFLNGRSSPVMDEVFQVKPLAPYSFRDKNYLHYLSILFLSPKIWLIVPQEIKNHKFLDYFKKSWPYVGYAKLAWNMLFFKQNVLNLYLRFI